ncbi:MAG TPA: hypothetical protein PK470_05525, partial [Candidatus Omnitrophota bacterium]|nr:hypothetical protein [Candidatus Omnitrophota bacterium]
NGVDPEGLKIYIRSHRVFGSQYLHSSILIVPDNQNLYINDDRFIKHSNGKLYLTLGAAPSIPGGFGSLVSDLNRSYDRAENNIRQGEVTLPCGVDEDSYIKNLLEADKNYQDNLKYQTFPKDYYNSNSYVAGLIQYTGGILPGLWGVLPGIDRPIPGEYFMDR